MKRVMRKSILIGVAITLFGLLGMAANSSAVGLSLPDPQTQLSTTIQGQNYFAWAHDDFWSYSARLMGADPVAVPVNVYGDWGAVVTGNGQLGVINANNAGSANPGTSLPDAYKELGSPDSYHVVWGAGGTGVVPGGTGTALVGDVLSYIQAGNPAYSTPVFGLTMAGQVPIAFVGHIYIADPGNPLVALPGLDWAFDNSPQTDTHHSSGTRGLFPTDKDGDYPGFDMNGTYNADAYATAIPFSGLGHLDYVTFAPSMNLGALVAGDPNLANDLFVMDFTMGGHIGVQAIGYGSTLGKPGNATVYMMNGVGVPVPGVPVPEPTTLLLLGFGLVGLAGMRRKFQK